MDLEQIQISAAEEIDKASSLEEIENIRVKYLGRKSEFVQFLRGIKDLGPEERGATGKLANDLKSLIEKKLEEKKLALEISEINRRLEKEKIDVTAPGKKVESGHLHPITRVRREVERIFHSMGFNVVEGPEVETEWYNFDALNVPADHPAREMQDTFWLKEQSGKNRLLPRTHTSAVQVRYMEKHQPPFRIIVPGRVFRNEATDATHEMQFYTFEGLMVGKDISLAHLKGVLETFARKFYKDESIEVKFVASYFPYTEPSVEVFMKGKKGKLKDRWIEMAGAGMVSQKVFQAAGYAPGEYQGFAFGMTIDRNVLFKYGIDDIRLLYSGDLRFLEQF